MSPYLREKSSDCDEILYIAADFELDERHVIKNEKVELDRQNVLFVYMIFIYSKCVCKADRAVLETYD